MKSTTEWDGLAERVYSRISNVLSVSLIKIKTINQLLNLHCQDSWKSSFNAKSNIKEQIELYFNAEDELSFLSTLPEPESCNESFSDFKYNIFCIS